MIPPSSRTALLLMDFQDGVVEKVDAPGLLARAARAAEAAREADAMVVFAKVGFELGYPEIGVGNKVWSQVAGSGMFEDGANPVAAALGPHPGDLVVDKKRISAFAGSGLGVILRAHGIDSLALAGIRTSGVVLSTLSAAADLDYRLTVLADACADPDPELHRLLVERLFPRDAAVLTVDAWAEGLGR